MHSRFEELNEVPGPESESQSCHSRWASETREVTKKRGDANQSEETGLLNSGFAPQKVGPAAIRVWLAFQIVGLLFQTKLWSEVVYHFSQYDQLVTRECPAVTEQHGVCQSTMWNLTLQQELTLYGGQTSNLTFSTGSSPPTLLLNVDPVKMDLMGPAWMPEFLLGETDWSLQVARLSPPVVTSVRDLFREGQYALTIEDLSEEAELAQRRQGHVEWQARVTSRTSKDQKATFVVFVQDALTLHLAEIRASPVCNFGSSWKAFNEQKNGACHRALSWCRFCWSVFLLVGAVAIGAVLRESGVEERPECDSSSLGQYRFHFAVIAKFVLCDMPQQIGAVLYLLGWFEAEGLRCQLCLFDVAYCAEEHPLQATNVVAMGCMFFSSIANQLLIRAVDRKIYTELDVCWNGLVRVALASISTLPFTTGVFMASGSLLSMPTLFHAAVALPCYVGWCIVAGMLSFPLIGCYVRIVELCEG